MKRELVLLAIVLAFSTRLCAQTAMFTRTTAIEMPGIDVYEPLAVVSADFNGDGLADLAVTTDESRVVVACGLAEGGFRGAGSYFIGGAPIGIVAADFNNDGKTDLATANSNNGSIALLINTGECAFRERGMGVPDEPIDLAAGDLNGDSKVDLVVSHVPGQVTVHLGNGDGSFQERSILAASGAGPTNFRIMLADLTGDGRLDLLVGRAGTDSVSVWIGNGDGSFQPERRAGIGPDPTTIAVADFNGDGVLDLAATCIEDQKEVWVALGNGDATFRRPLAVKTDGGHLAIATGDWNGDGHTDLAIPDHFRHTVSIALGNGDGSFREPQPIPAGVGPGWVTTADFDRDGLPDLAVTNSGSHNLSIIQGRSDGKLAIRRSVGGFLPTALLTGEFSGDDLRDIAIVNGGDECLHLLPWTAESRPGTALEFPLGRNPGAAITADFNRDGVMDLLAGAFYGREARLLRGRAGGGFDEPSAVSLREGVLTLSPADLNNDGYPDAIAAIPGSIAILLAGPDGFAEPRYVTAGEFPTVVAAADFTGDGAADLAVIDAAGRLLLARGNGDGSFQEATQIQRTAFTSMSEGDLNGDGKPDLIMVDSRRKLIVVLKNEGEGRFTSLPPSLMGDVPARVVITDMDQDQRLDVAVLGERTVSVLLGTGDGSLRLVTTVPVGKGAPLVAGAAADLNGAGRPDVVVASRDGIFILWNER